MNYELRQPKLGFLILSGIMLGCSFPPISINILAAFAFVPFFIAFESLESYRQSTRSAYIMLVVFNVITLYWAGGFVHAKDMYLMTAGTLLLFAHPLFFFVAIIPWTFFRRQFGFKSSVVAFPFFWVGFEYLHSLTELAFPWLTLGNSQVNDLPAIQFASLTGSYGISFWLLWMNVVTYFIYRKIINQEWKTTSRQTILAIVGLLVLYLLPKMYGSVVLKRSDQPIESSKTVRIAIVQPNIDPFEKWEESGMPQLDTLQRLTSEAAQQNVDLVVWPETAIPFYITMPQNLNYFQSIKRQVDSCGINLLSGFPDLHYYASNEIAPRSSNITKDGQRYNTYNSSILLSSQSATIQKYSKIVLVPFAERVPFSEAMSILNAARWNFGLGGWGIGTDTTVFECRTKSGAEMKFSNLICYESVYPGFVAGFVRKGAQFLTVITNDSWWGNTSGAYQHEQIGVLRAIENRRWIARCANGGISCFIDPFGHILQPTKLFTRDIIVANIEPKTELTFYSRHGDWFAQTCLIMGIVFVVAAIGRKYFFSKREEMI